MPILKHQQAAPLLKDAIVLDLSDVARQAERMREQAREQAQRIVQEAEQRAQTLIDGAEAKGHEQGYQAGHEKGLAEGHEQGRAEALEQMRQQLEALHATWARAAQQWSDQRAQLESEARRNIIDLALKVAEKLVHRVVEVDPTVVVDQTGAALSHVLRSLDVIVHIHPDDRPLLDEALPQLTRAFNHLQHIELADDETIRRGGCIASFGQGQVDASLETQVERIVKAMLPDDVAPVRTADCASMAPRHPANADADEEAQSEAPSHST